MRRPSRRVVVMPIISAGGGFPYLHQRHREQIDRRRQTKPARLLGSMRQIARQLVKLVSP